MLGIHIYSFSDGFLDDNLTILQYHGLLVHDIEDCEFLDDVDLFLEGPNEMDEIFFGGYADSGNAFGAQSSDDEFTPNKSVTTKKTTGKKRNKKKSKGRNFITSSIDLFSSSKPFKSAPILDQNVDLIKENEYMEKANTGNAVFQPTHHSEEKKGEEGDGRGGREEGDEQFEEMIDITTEFPSELDEIYFGCSTENENESDADYVV